MNAPYCVIHEFLFANLFRQLVALVVQRQGLFRRETRDGQIWGVLEEFGTLQDSLHGVLRAAWHDVAPRLALRSSDPGNVEMCVRSLAGRSEEVPLATTDGDLELGFVLFLHREPRRFDGGALHLRAGMDEIVFAPAQNSVVFFPTSVHARTGPLRTPSEALVDSRLTLEGRIRAFRAGHPPGTRTAGPAWKDL